MDKDGMLMNNLSSDINNGNSDGLKALKEALFLVNSSIF